jgi:hypothetical protein
VVWVTASTKGCDALRLDTQSIIICNDGHTDELAPSLIYTFPRADFSLLDAQRLALTESSL